MQKTQVIIMGYKLDILFTVHEPAYVEWSFVATERFKEAELLNVLLRTHYSDYIEASCREASFYRNFAEAQGFDTDFGRDAGLAYRSIFDEEDIPF